MKNIDYNQFSAEELEAMLSQIDEKKSAPDRQKFYEQRDEEQRKFRNSSMGQLVRPFARVGRAAVGSLGDLVDLIPNPEGIPDDVGKLKLRERIDEATEGSLMPRDSLEEGLDTVSEAAATLPIGGPAVKVASGALTKGQKVARFLQGALASQKINPLNVAGAGSAALAGKYMAEENPLELENPVAKGAASLAASVGAGSIPAGIMAGVKGIKGIPEWAATKMAKTGDFDPSAVEHARAAGIDILPADALKSKQAKRQQQAMASMPFVGGKIQNAMEKRYEQALEALGQSNPANLSKEAGAELVEKGSKANYEHHEKQFGKEYSDIGKKIASHDKKGKFVDPSHSLAYLESLRNKLKTKVMQAEFDASPIGQRRDKLIAMAAENNGHVPYNDMVEFKKAVDSSITNFGTHGEIPSGQRKRLSGLINEDVGNYLQSIDPELKDSWKKVNKEYSLYKDKTLPAINKVLKNEKAGTDIGGLISVLPNKKDGGKALKNVLDHLPTAEEKQQLFDIVMRTAGTDNKGNFSMVKAYNYFNSLTPSTRNRLLSASGKSAAEIKKYKSVMETVNNIWKTSLEENFPGTSKHLIQQGILASVAVNIGAGNWLGAAKTISGIAIATAGTAAGLKNNRLINAMYSGFKKENMTRKEFYDWCGKVSKADPTFKEVVTNTLKTSGIREAKSHLVKGVVAEEPKAETPAEPQQEAPIDYSQYSEEQLEDMLRQAEGQ